mgnify:CR=1 FL=1|jgi:hypothetical protein
MTRSTSCRRCWPIAASLVLITLLAGCAGYQLGLDSLYRPDIKTVHVPVFDSDSYRRGLGEQLTEAVVKEIESRTPYRVVSSTAADSILRGRILTDRKHVLAENSFDEARDIETELLVEVSWLDRQGEYLLQRSVANSGKASLEIGQAVNFVPEAGQSLATAHQEAIQKLARQIVGQMELRW